jgi:hypothetical protein
VTQTLEGEESRKPAVLGDDDAASGATGRKGGGKQ